MRCALTRLPDNWGHADLALSRIATRLAGSLRYVCVGRDSETNEPAIMVADGKSRPIHIALDRPVYDGDGATMSLNELVETQIKPALAVLQSRNA